MTSIRRAPPGEYVFDFITQWNVISTGNYQTNLSAQPKVNPNYGLRPKLTPQIKLSLRLWSEQKSEPKVKVTQYIIWVVMIITCNFEHWQYMYIDSLRWKYIYDLIKVNLLLLSCVNCIVLLLLSWAPIYKDCYELS